MVGAADESKMMVFVDGKMLFPCSWGLLLQISLRYVMQRTKLVHKEPELIVVLFILFDDIFSGVEGLWNA